MSQAIGFGFKTQNEYLDSLRKYETAQRAMDDIKDKMIDAMGSEDDSKAKLTALTIDYGTALAQTQEHLNKCAEMTHLVYYLNANLETPSDIGVRIKQMSDICDEALAKGRPFIENVKRFELKLFSFGTLFGFFLGALAFHS